MRFINKPFFLPFYLIILLPFVTLFVLPISVYAATYQPLRTPVIGDNAVNELGEVFARFEAGQLRKNDSVIFRLPSGFIWTTADPGSGQTAASAAYQTTEQWNKITFNDNYVIYGDVNYIKVPKSYNNNDNGLFKGTTPTLNIERVSNNEIKVEIVDDPVPGQECFLYLYVNRIYIESGYRGYVAIKIDAPSGSGFDNGGVPSGQVVGSGTHPGNKLICRDIPEVYAGLPRQKVGTIAITEAVAGSLASEHTLTLQLPAGAKWVTLDEDSTGSLKILPAGSSRDGGRIAEFKFVGTSSAPATLELKDMEVALEPGVTGDLKVKAGGTAGLNGELTVAKIIEPDAVFTIGQPKYMAKSAFKAMDVAPYLKGDRVYLPLRFVAAALGLPENDIIWDEINQSVTLKKGENIARLMIGSNILYMNDMPKTMDVAPEVVEPGRIMVPFRWVAEALNAEINWDPAVQRVVVKSK